MAQHDWIETLLARGRWPLVVIVAVVTLLLGLRALDAQLERSNESMEARSAEQQAAWDRFTASFGGGEVIVFALRDERLLDGDGLARLAAVEARIKALDGVDRVLSLVSAVEIVAGEFGAMEAPLVPLGERASRAALESRLARNPELADLLVSSDRKTAALLVDLEERAADDSYRPRIVEALRGLKSDLARDGIDAHVTGITVQKYDTSRYVARDQRVLLPASVLVLAAVLAWVTRRVSGVVLPLGVTAVALVWTVGIYSWLGFRINVITSLLPPVVMVVSIATAMHIYQGWVAAGPREADRQRLAARVVGRLAYPCALTAVTTAMGLGSLAASDMPAVRQFGLFGALGVALSLLLNLTLLPAALSFLRPPERDLDRDSRLGPLLDRVSELTVRRPRAILAVTGALTVAALAGVAQVENNTDLVRFLDPEAELVRDTLWVDSNVVGTNALELMIERRDGRPLTGVQDVRRIDRLGRDISSLEPVTNVLSVTGILARLAAAEWNLPEASLPSEPDDLLYLFDLLAASERQDELGRLITPDFRRARLAVRVHAMGTADAERLIRLIERLGADSLGDELTVVPVGSLHAMTVDSNRLVATQAKSFTLAFAMVFLALAAVFRSARLLLAATAPNLVPIVWCGGVMGWLGIDLSTATAMVASVVIGIAVDDTIHYLARFRTEHRGDVAEALRRTTRSTGRVLVIASTVLALGFWVGALGSFRPTIWFSLLTGTSIMAALACDLLVLPACLVLLSPQPDKVAR